MLAKRIIPVLLCKGYTLVKGKQFVPDRVVGNLIQAVEIFNLRWADEIMVLDVTASEEGRSIDPEMVDRAAERNLVPLTVGGGIRTVEQGRALLQGGADKLCIGSGQYIDNLIRQLSNEFGKQAVVVSIDYDTHYDTHENLEDRCYQVIEEGAGEILLQCRPRDGMMQGYDLVDLDLDVPVILSCGAGTYEHLYEGLQVADAVAAGSMWLFTDQTPKEAKQYLSKKGMEVRL